jgi:predicted transcriptional regulator
VPKNPKKENKSDAVRRLKREHPDWSLSEIARQVGCSPQNVHAALNKKRKKHFAEEGEGEVTLGGLTRKLNELRQMWTEVKAASALITMRIRQIEELIHG